MSRSPIPTLSFSLVIAQRKSDGRFLVVKETRNRGWWIPAGHVEPAETFQTAALRETVEEAGIDVVLEGVLRIEHTVKRDHNRMRVIFFARPKDEAQKPKTQPDEESEEARWVSLDEWNALKKAERARGGEPDEWFNYLASGGKIFPLEVFTTEYAPVKVV